MSRHSVFTTYLIGDRVRLLGVRRAPVQAQYAALGGVPREQHVVLALDQVLGATAVLGQMVAQRAEHCVATQPEAVGLQLGHAGEGFRGRVLESLERGRHTRLGGFAGLKRAVYGTKSRRAKYL